MERHQVAIVGAGQAGIATALALSDRGIRPLVVDRADDVASAWRGRYERLRLNTSRMTSRLPGRRYPKGTPLFPSREQVIEHLAGHAASAEIELRLGTSVERVSSLDGGWVLETPGAEIRAVQLVLATGYEGEPVIPDWPGRDQFAGELLHSGEYRNAEPFAGKDVLVVGPGCSGMEIAYDLCEGGADRVMLAVRTPPTIILRQGPGGLPGDWIGITLLRFPTRVADTVSRFGSRKDIGDLSEFGLPAPDDGLMTRFRRDGTVPTIVDREVIEAIRERRIEIVAAVSSLASQTVELADGTQVQPDAIISATGYRRSLEPLAGHLGVLDQRGAPKLMVDPAAPGLRFVGYTSRPGALGYMGKQAKRVARQIEREL